MNIKKYPKYLFNYILSLAYDAWYFFFGSIKQRIGNFEYYRQSKKFPGYLKEGEAMPWINSLAGKYCQGCGVDIGSSRWPLENARPIQNGKEENAYSIKEADNSLDFVFSSHVLEHLVDWRKALAEWKRVLKKDGIMFLYLPHPAVQMWKKGVNPAHVWNPQPADLEKYFQDELRMEILEISFSSDGYLSFYVAARKA